ncbi:MAG: selenium cofactor biosynthesis protein YqeC [Acidiferrobacterales bacterium]
MTAAERLLDALHARTGLVCAVGAGGKKTTLYRLAVSHPGRVALTSTVFIPPFPKDLPMSVIRDNGDRLLESLGHAVDGCCIAYTQRSCKRGRFEGVPTNVVQDIHEKLGFDVTFVKADGARNRLIKAPAEEEPQLPGKVTTVIMVVSVRAINRALDERIAHRIEQIEHVTGVERGGLLTPSHVARLFASEKGLLKDTGNAHVVPLINMVDDEKARGLALETAQEALRTSKRFDRIILASMRHPDPIVEIVERTP